MAFRSSLATMPSQSHGSSDPISGQRHDRYEVQSVPIGEPPDDEEEITASLYQKMLSAVAGSLLTSVLVTPLDVVRVRLQSQPQQNTFTANAARAPLNPTPVPLPNNYSFSNLPPNLGISTCCREVFWVSNNTQYCVATPSTTTPLADSSVKSAASCAADEVQRKTYTSTWDGMRKIAQNEGPRTLWRGLSPTLLMAVPANVIYFAGYDWLRYNKKSPFRKAGMKETYIPLVAGSSARILAAFAVNPIEMFRTRMQAAHSSPGQTGRIAETAQGMREMIAAKGYRTLFTGLNLTLWRDVPFSAIYWWGYEYVREEIREIRAKREQQKEPSHGTRRRRKSLSQEDHTTTLIDSFIAGATSGAFAAFVTTPFDVGKTRQQVLRYSKTPEIALASAAASGPRPEELSMPRFLWHIFQNQGTAGLFRGWAARCLKVAPGCAIMISSYEIGKKMAGQVNERKELQE